MLNLKKINLLQIWYSGENLQIHRFQRYVSESNRVQLEWTSDFVNVEGFEIYRKKQILTL